MFEFLSKFLPLFTYPVGLACLLLFLALIFRKHSRFHKWMGIIALLVLFLGGNRWVTFLILRSLEWQNLPLAEIPPADVIVVLGGGTEPPLAPRSNTEVNSAGDRVLQAARLYKQGKAGHILLSGGNIEWMASSSTTPAEDMAEILMLTGVPQNAIWMDKQSRNTSENALFTKVLLERQGYKRIYLVTSAMHMPRSLALFKKQGLEVVPIPTDFTATESEWKDLTSFNLRLILVNLIPNSSNLAQTTNAIKEYWGILVYSLRGWT